jgi:hypothetical protein
VVRRTAILGDGLRLAEVLVVALATAGAFLLLTFFGVAAALDGIRMVTP